jgi:hypothetical protein
MPRPSRPRPKMVLKAREQVGDHDTAMKLYNIGNYVFKMDNPAIQSIYDNLPDIIEYIRICPFYIVSGRPVIKVLMIKYFDNENETVINQTFYQSTGTSRGIHDIEGIWFPGGEIVDVIRISKVEDTYYEELATAYNQIKHNIPAAIYSNTVNVTLSDGNKLNILADEERYKYSRFITKIFASISKFLWYHKAQLKDIMSDITPYTLPDKMFDNLTFEDGTEIESTEFFKTVENTISQCRKDNYIIIHA